MLCIVGGVMHGFKYFWAGVPHTGLRDPIPAFFAQAATLSISNPLYVVHFESVRRGPVGDMDGSSNRQTNFRALATKQFTQARTRFSPRPPRPPSPAVPVPLPERHSQVIKRKASGTFVEFLAPGCILANGGCDSPAPLPPFRGMARMEPSHPLHACMTGMHG
jgi:hypothetical protein